MTDARMKSGFSASEETRLALCVDRLASHVDRARIALTGGVAIQLGLAALGKRGPRTRVADLDFVATSIDAVTPRATGTFLVSHFHTVQAGIPKFMIQLVDPLTRIRIDIFPD